MDWVKPRKTSVRIARGPAEIRTEIISNKNIERYRYGNPLGVTNANSQIF
jgi:hypothetical protein